MLSNKHDEPSVGKSQESCPKAYVWMIGRSNAMSEYVWVCDALNNEASLFAFTKTDMISEGAEKAIEAELLNKGGQSVPLQLCPVRIWADDGVEDYEIAFEARNPEPDLFFTGTHWVVSERAANILRQFDLGGGALHPVSEGVFRKDQETRLPKEYFSWVFGNEKTAFRGENSKNLRGPRVSGAWYKMSFTPADGDVAVSCDALQGADVWLDKMLFKTIFLSGPLGDALVAAGLGEVFYLTKARLV